MNDGVFPDQRREISSERRIALSSSAECSRSGRMTILHHSCGNDRIMKLHILVSKSAAVVHDVLTPMYAEHFSQMFVLNLHREHIVLQSEQTRLHKNYYIKLLHKGYRRKR